LAKSCENDGESFDTFDNLILSRTPMSKRQKKKRKNQAFAVTEAPLKSLIVEDFDENQIWEEIQLQNSYIYDPLVSAVSKVLAQQNRPASLGESDEDNSDDSAEELLKDINAGGEYEEEDDELSDFFENANNEKKSKKKNLVYSKSIVDDKFFNLAQMTEFIEKMDAEEDGKRRGTGDDDDDNEEELDGIDMFKGDEEDVEADYYYKDFFDPPPNSLDADSFTNKKDTNWQAAKKSVTFADDEADDEMADSLPNIEDNEKGSGNDPNKKSHQLLLDDDSESSEVDESTLSNFEKKRRKIEKTIEEMEEEALQPKPWQLTGEVTAETRPENSLLEEHLIYDHLIKQGKISLKFIRKVLIIIQN